MSKLIVMILAVLMFTSSAYANEWDYDPYAPTMVEVSVAHVADLGSTALALALIDGATETNPLGWYLIPAKLVVTYGLIPFYPEEQQVSVGHIVSDITYGATVNNMIILAGASGSVPIVGGLIASSYLLACDFEVLPEYVCLVGGYKVHKDLYAEMDFYIENYEGLTFFEVSREELEELNGATEYRGYELRLVE